MKPLNWIRFTWNLAALPETGTELPDHYEISRPTQDDETELRKVISSSFSLDPSWNPALQDIVQTIDVWLERAWEPETSVCLALRHGLRIIGAAVLRLEPDATNHFSPGPCILMEYRNRGFGTRLLEHSLRALRDAGLSAAHAVAEENSPVTKFLYSKFDSTLAPHESSPLAARAIPSSPEDILGAHTR